MDKYQYALRDKQPVVKEFWDKEDIRKFEKPREQNPSPLIGIAFKFDWREELDRAVRQATMFMPMKPIFLNGTKEEVQAARQKWYASVQSTVNLARQGYLIRLEAAAKTGGIDHEDYVESLSRVRSVGVGDEFARVLEKARQELR